MVITASSLFPSPQGGSETTNFVVKRRCQLAVSIPSRRVGDLKRLERERGRWSVSIPSRRVGDRALVVYATFYILVSIPSRRVGDWLGKRLLQRSQRCFHPLKAGRRLVRQAPSSTLSKVFPSPQGGSETTTPNSCWKLGSCVSIPSRRVGDAICPIDKWKVFIVSIPSRRVGDAFDLVTAQGARGSFHPLKAGRRRPPLPTIVCPLSSGFHPLKAGRRLVLGIRFFMGIAVSIPSRRVGDVTQGRCSRCLNLRFHPLKAGRRLRPP